METRAWIEETAGACVAGPPELVQELWSGYGAIERWPLRASDGDTPVSVVLKRVDAPMGTNAHPRGWTSGFADARKRRSYAVERAFYREHAPAAAGRARLPRRLGERASEGGGMLLLEDLDASGFPRRVESASDPEIRACVRWLAAFHGAFLGRAPDALWTRGTYWHLATRPHELEATEDPALRAAAPWIDARLGDARFRTLVHGDAKLANFCFAPAGEKVAAVDLQYVGGGIGVQDLSYFLGSCLDDRALETRADVYLDAYFEDLRHALHGQAVDVGALEAEWRGLWPDAWADFHRFLAGWAPGHWKLSRFSERMTSQVLDRAAAP